MKTSFLNKTYSGIRKTHFWKNTHVLEDMCVFKNGFSKIVNIEVTTQNHLNARWRTLINPLFQSKYPHLVNKLEYKSSSGKPKSRAYKRLKLGQNVFWKILDVYIAVTWFRSWEIFLPHVIIITWFYHVDRINVLFEIENQFWTISVKLIEFFQEF